MSSSTADSHSNNEINDIRRRLRPRGREDKVLVPVIKKLKTVRVVRKKRGVVMGVATPPTSNRVELEEDSESRSTRIKKWLEDNRTKPEEEEETDAVKLVEEEKGDKKDDTYQGQEKEEGEEERPVHIPKLRRTVAKHHIVHFSSNEISSNSDTTTPSPPHPSLPPHSSPPSSSSTPPTPPPPPHSSSSSDSSSSNGEDKHTEYPKPSSNQQKMQRKLARQKQLEEMRIREAALARQERLLRRRGLKETTPRGQLAERHVKWREEEDLVMVFQYSPRSSSRGSTLDPEDIPELDTT